MKALAQTKTFVVAATLSTLAMAAPAAAQDVGVEVDLRDDVRSCDHDGLLDFGEEGSAVITVRNFTNKPLVDAQVALSTRHYPLVYPRGATFTMPKIPAKGALSVSWPVSLAQPEIGKVELQARVTPAEPGLSAAVGTGRFVVHLDERVGVSRFDDVSMDLTAWRVAGPPAFGAGAGWSRGLDEHGNRVWFVTGSASGADASLITPQLVPAFGADFTVRFAHRHDFSTGPALDQAGGVVEISLDGGATWEDAAEYAAGNPYSGVLGEHAGSLEGRKAFVGGSPSLPARDAVVLDFGRQFQGDHVWLRFRMGAVAGPRGAGWEIDDIEVQGTVDAPFAGQVAEDGKCGPPLVGGTLRAMPVVRAQQPEIGGAAPSFEGASVTLDPAPAEGVSIEDEPSARLVSRDVTRFSGFAQASYGAHVDPGGCSQSAGEAGALPLSALLIAMGWARARRRRR